MSSYKKTMFDSGKYNQNDIPTAAKTAYLETSPYLNTPDIRSPNRIQSRIEEVRESISSMISQMGSKKNINAQAIQKVKNANSQALSVLREQTNFVSYTPKKQERINFPRQHKSYGAQPNFLGNFDRQNYGYQEQVNPSGFNLQGLERPNEYHPIAPPNIPQYKSLEQQNAELRRALNQQIRINNQLVKRINHLQAENYSLRNQMGQNQTKGLRSTRANYTDETLNLSGRNLSPIGVVQTEPYIQGNNQSYNNYNNQNISQGYNQGYSSHVYNGTGYSSPAINSLGYSKRNTNYQPNVQSSGEYSGLFAELDRLKRQNQTLRQNTIHLLKTN